MICAQSCDIDLFLRKEKIQTRPNAGHGLWLMFLLPLAIIISSIANPILITPAYKLSTIFSFGLIISSIVFINQSSRKQCLQIYNIWMLIACLSTVILFRICLHRGYLFCLWSGLMCTVFYQKLYFFILKKLPNCFTLGEAGICAQAYTLLIHFTAINIGTITKYKATPSILQMSTLTSEVGLIGLSIIIVLSYQFNIKDPVKFYILTALVFIFVIVLPLQFLMKMNPLMLIINMFMEDLQRYKILLYWILFSILAVLVVNNRIKNAQRANTSVRKIFHFLVVAVFVPGLLYNCSLLYLASGVVLGIFFMLEILRVLNIPPLAESLHNGLIIFGDEKDVGIIAFTPMYLLGGCALPLWIHPAPCDVTNSALFNLLPLLSGVLTIGIGDTAASIVGSKLGSHYWKNSSKTIEGTIGYILSQMLFIVIFVHFDYIRLVSMAQYIKTVLAVIITAIIEAKTDQVDNLVLPFVMYILLVI